jgi:hypothetical protein
MSSRARAEPRNGGNRAERRTIRGNVDYGPLNRGEVQAVATNDINGINANGAPAPPRCRASASLAVDQLVNLLRPGLDPGKAVQHRGRLVGEHRHELSATRHPDDEGLVALRR